MMAVGVCGVFQMHVEKGGEASVEARRNRSFVEIGVFDDVGIERGEEPGEMFYLIERYVVEHAHVFIRSASVYVHSRESGIRLRHSRENLESLYQVGFSQDGWSA